MTHYSETVSAAVLAALDDLPDLDGKPVAVDRDRDDLGRMTGELGYASISVFSGEWNEIEDFEVGIGSQAIGHTIPIAGRVVANTARELGPRLSRLQASIIRQLQADAAVQNAVFEIEADGLATEPTGRDHGGVHALDFDLTLRAVYSVLRSDPTQRGAI
ncbi:MAG: hypothetical protein CL484_07565 [Acidobacteria bacterium]|nr:hypothetical protein [Acidobacteriota bacterium]|tara:strand:+ start:1752 stop:2231 length:480 start_codon:yes stop_codon:yes gene_type:complete